MEPLCIYHGNCADGFTAAWAVWRAVPTCEFYPGTYGETPPDVAGRDVIIVDFSYPRAVLDEMARSARTVIVLDHHRTAMEDLRTMILPPDGPWDPERLLEQGCGYCAIFDMDRSGAQITWDHFHPGGERPVLVDYVADRDLWRFELPRSREVSAFISVYDHEFREWEDLHSILESDVTHASRTGAVLEKKHLKDVNEIVRLTQRTMRIGDLELPTANVPPSMISDAGNIMATAGSGAAACYWDSPEGRVFSLRSTASGPDVSEIARRYGGGGHRNAAGFRMPRGWEGE